jgi:hypothetical protein
MTLTKNQKAILLLIFSVFLILGIIVLIKLLNMKKRDKKCIPITTCTGTDCSNGSDGCKGTCTCPDSQKCVEGKCVVDCIPITTCKGTDCSNGSDGCKGACTCPDSKKCTGGKCVDCIPITTCTGTDCSNGSDGCKGACTCPDSQKCTGGKCVVACIPITTCTGYDCSVGSDGCKGTCTCPDSQKCVKGRCFNPLIQNMFVAVGNPYTFSQPDKPQNQFTGIMATSKNGIDWVPIPDQVFSNFASGIACNGLIWVVVGSSNDFSIAWSPNGNTNTWINADNSMNMIFSQGGKQVKWNGNLWVAVGGGDYSIAWSLDGKYWNGVKDSPNILLEGTGISWNGKNWIAVGRGTYSIATSQDGKNWKAVENSGKLFVNANAVACNEKTCVVVGEKTYGKTYNTIAWSLDGGFTWKGLDNENNIFSTGNDVKWTGNTWIAVGIPTAIHGKKYPIAISPNGNDWTYIESFSGDSIQSIEWNENLFVFSTSNGIVTSTDLITFKTVPNILTKGALGISWW